MNYKEAATWEIEKVLSELGSGTAGLSPVVATSRAASEPNVIARAPSSAAAILWRQVRSPMVLVLIIAFLVALFTRDLGSSITILVFVLLNTGLGFAQEFRSEHIIQKLDTYIASYATVRRGGVVSRVPRETVVPGDITILEPGDAFPGDARLLIAENLQVDESVLTGESAPATKDTAPMRTPPGTPADARPLGFAGTIVIAGSAEAVVFATGSRTAFGMIAAQTTEVKRPSIFEKNVSAFSRFILKVVIITLTAVYVANLIIKGSAAHPAELLLFALALAVSVIPEALPTVMTITFSRGALKLAKKKVVIKRLSAIEDLGHIEVLCTDKTGTITENKLQVGRISCLNTDVCLQAAMLSIELPTEGIRDISSFDTALWNFVSDEQRTFARAAVRREMLPFDPVRRRNTVIADADGKTFLAVKGAPEELLALSGADDAERARVMDEFRQMGREGMRALALGIREVAVKADYSPEDERGIRFVGLVGFTDPLKPTAKDAIALAEKLHVRVKIVTGDSFDVAASIGMQVGIIESREDAVNGPDLAALTDEEFAGAVERYDVFARVTPELKYRIVSQLEKKHATGFLGEGINDAPALKAANVALVVAGASDVAREAADVVLLDKSLDVVVDGIREGRTMYANVLKYIKYTLVGNFGNFYSIALISLFIDFLPITPEQILLINLLTDFPLIAVALDRVDLEDLATPRRFNLRDIALYTTVLGLVSSVFDFIFFGVFRHAAPGTLQTMFFYESVLSEILLIFALRTNRFMFAARPPARTLTLLGVVTVIITIALPFTAFGQHVFHFVHPERPALIAVFVIVLGYLCSTEAAKLAYHKFWGKVRLASPRA